MFSKSKIFIGKTTLTEKDTRSFFKSKNGRSDFLLELNADMFNEKLSFLEYETNMSLTNLLNNLKSRAGIDVKISKRKQNIYNDIDFMFIVDKEAELNFYDKTDFSNEYIAIKYLGIVSCKLIDVD